MREAVILLLATAAVVQFPRAVFAQSGSDESVASGEIIVTARRREESISKVPIAITALSGEDLAKRAIYSENDLQSAVPGLVIRQNGGVHAFNYAIRGQSVDTFSNSPPSVLPYINDVQIVTHSASTFYDLAGIQVLKGPQGTLFGRNTTGGAVQYSTARAGGEFGGYLQARYGRFDSRHIEGAINLPLGEQAALRIAGSYTGGGAFVRDFFTNEEYGDIDQKSIRGTLRLSPIERLTNTTVVQYTRETGTNTPYELWSTNQCGTSVGTPPLVDSASCALHAASNPVFAAYLAAHPQVYQGGLDGAISLQRTLGPWVSLASYPPFHKARSVYAVNTTTLELSESLTLKNIFGYNTSRSNDGYDYDGSPYHYFENQGTLTADAIKVVSTAKVTSSAGFLLDTRQISNELQLQGKGFDGRLDFVVGVYYLNQRDSVVSNLDFGNYLPAAAPFSFTYTAQTDVKSIAGFGQASFRVTDKLSLTGGFRYTRDKTSLFQLPGSLWLNFVASNAKEKAEASKPSWTASIDYRATPELMIYAVTRGSWRSGGYNYSVFPANVTAVNGGNLFLPETTEDIEVGVKYAGDSLGMPITMNVDVFNQWVSNIQRAANIQTAAGASLLTVNVPKARITGVEGDVSIRPSEWLQFGASGNYTNARYTSARVDVLGNTVIYGPFADVPKFSGTLFGEVGMPLGGDAGELRLRTDAYGQTRMHFSNVSGIANPSTTLPGYVLVNGRLTWSKIMGSTLSASLFARNLFNRKYYSGGNPSAAGGLTNTVNPGLPRIWGGEVRASF